MLGEAQCLFKPMYIQGVVRLPAGGTSDWLLEAVQGPPAPQYHTHAVLECDIIGRLAAWRLIGDLPSPTPHGHLAC